MRSRLTIFSAGSATRCIALASPLAFALALASTLAGCASQSNGPPLPDLATKNQPPSGQPTMSSAQQKQAIDQMIAKRDAK